MIQSSDPGSVGAYLGSNAGVSSFENNVLDVVSLSVNAALLGFDDVLKASNTYEAPLQVRASTATGADLVWVSASYGGRNNNTGNLNFLSGSLVTVGSVAFTHSNNYAGVVHAGSAPVFTGPPTDRVYTFNGFDCVRDVAAGTCEQL